MPEFLIESNPQGIVVGMGINVNNQPSLDSATSLQQQMGKPLELHQALSTMLTSFVDVLEQANQDSDLLLQQCENRLAFLNQEIELTSGSQQLAGVLVGLDQMAA